MSYTPLNRQQVQENKTTVGGGAICCTIPWVVAALIIAYTYNEDYSPCEDGTNYTVDPQTFLMVLGYVLMGSTILSCLAAISESLVGVVGICQCPAGLFLIAWAIIGIYMYANQFSDDCQQTHAGLMIIIWSGFLIGVIGLVCICTVCIACCGMIAG